MRQKIIDLIIDILHLDIDANRSDLFSEDTLIENVEGWDSLAHVLIIGEMENRLGISIPLEEAIEITTIGELFEKAGESDGDQTS